MSHSDSLEGMVGIVANGIPGITTGENPLYPTAQIVSGLLNKGVKIAAVSEKMVELHHLRELDPTIVDSETEGVMIGDDLQLIARDPYTGVFEIEVPMARDIMQAVHYDHADFLIHVLEYQDPEQVQGLVTDTMALTNEFRKSNREGIIINILPEYTESGLARAGYSASAIPGGYDVHGLSYRQGDIEPARMGNSLADAIEFIVNLRPEERIFTQSYKLDSPADPRRARVNQTL